MTDPSTPSIAGDDAHHREAPPAAHYLFALLITLIVTGLAFPVKDFGTKWTVFTVGVVMDVSVLIAFARDMLRRPHPPRSR